MTHLHQEFALVIHLSNRWHALDADLWYVGLKLAKAQNVSLLALVYERLRVLRDDVAREAFTRRMSIGEVARERLAALRHRRVIAPIAHPHEVNRFA